MHIPEYLPGILFSETIRKKSVPVPQTCCADISEAHSMSPLWCKNRRNGTQHSLVTELLSYIYELLSSFVVKAKQLDVLIGKIYLPQNATRWQKKIACKIISPVFMFAVLWYVHLKTFIVKWRVPRIQEWAPNGKHYLSLNRRQTLKMLSLLVSCHDLECFFGKK